MRQTTNMIRQDALIQRRLHLRIWNAEMIWELMITEGNKQKRQEHF